MHGIQHTLKLWLSHDECTSLLHYLDDDKSGTLEVKEFEEKINQQNIKIRKQPAWTCTKSNLLTSLTEEYDAKQLRDDLRL